MAEDRFEKLMSPFHIGRVQTRNRIIKTAAGMGFSDVSGRVTDKYKTFYEALARGGVGLSIVGTGIFDYPSGAPQPDLLRLDRNENIPGLIELVEIHRKYGCPTFIQFMHAGPLCPTSFSGTQPLASSSLTESELAKLDSPSMKHHGHKDDLPRGLTVSEIEGLVDKCATAAERAQKAGFDGVEINAAGNHLLNSFLSRAWNKREDDYGYASLENRARFLVEIIREIKKRLGQDYPVTTILNIAEIGAEKGITVEEAQAFAKILQDTGVDAIQARGYGYRDYDSVGWPEQVFYPEPPKPLPRTFDWSRRGVGSYVPLAAEIKKVVSIPVITVGRLDPVLGEQVLKQGKADFIGLTRRLLADPELPNKVASGRLEDIAPCTACMSCISTAFLLRPVPCRVNAAVGIEQNYEIKPAEKKKKVVIVGGGPAGMEAARVAALRGHEVILYEREPKLGGLLPLAALIKGLEIEDLVALARYLKSQITKLGVTIRLGKEVNPSVIEETKPDVVILATGGIPAVPEITGINRRNVVSAAALHQRVKIYLRLLGPKALRWLTRFWMPLGKRVVIIGGAIQGCELAEFLVKRGRQVTIVDTAETLGEGVVLLNKLRLFSWLTKKGVTMMTGVKYEEITDKGLTIITKDGQRQTIEADTIVTAMPFRTNTELLRTIEGKVPEIYAIGDCSEPRLIIDAIADGQRIARAL